MCSEEQRMGRDSLLDGKPEGACESHEHELLECLKAPIRSSLVDCNMFLALESPLLELINISRSSEGRAKLAELRIIPSLLVLFEQFHQTCQISRGYPPGSSSAEFIDVLLLLLKLTRNLCAGDSTNQDGFREAGGVAILAPIATALVLSLPGNARQSGGYAGPSKDVHEKDAMLERITARFNSTAISSELGHDCAISTELMHGVVDCLQMMLQLLGNFARCGQASQAAMWEEFFPSLLLDLAALRINNICGPLCMVLYTCCKGSSEPCWQLCQGDGAALIALLMVSTVDDNADFAPGNGSSSEGQIEWFELLVQHLCIGEPLFPLLFTNLGVPPLSLELDLVKVNTDELLRVCQLGLETSTYTSLQAGLLFILCDCLSSQVTNTSALGTCGDEDEQVDEKLPMPLQCMCFMVDILRQAAQLAAGDTEQSTSVTVQILEAVLLLLRISCAWDSNHGDRKRITSLFLSHGLIELLLGLLEALGAPQAPGKGPGDLRLEDRLPHGMGMFPDKNIYQGYRRDIVAVIANISHQNFLVQERVRHNGSLLLVLQQCMVEKDNPFLREWGLWAMRNLLEGNVKNQEEIADLEVKESMNLPELRKMGLNVEIDPSTRRPRLVNESSSSS